MVCTTPLHARMSGDDLGLASDALEEDLAVELVHEEGLDRGADPAAAAAAGGTSAASRSPARAVSMAVLGLAPPLAARSEAVRQTFGMAWYAMMRTGGDVAEHLVDGLRFAGDGGGRGRGGGRSADERAAARASGFLSSEKPSRDFGAASES